MMGTQQLRTGGNRSRRALAAGGAVAVLGAALVGGTALVLPDTPVFGADPAVSSAPASMTEEPETVEPTVQPVSVPVASDPAAPAAEPAGLVAEPAAPAVDSEAPWQDTPPPLPEGGLLPENPDWPNAWEIPDARPSGVDHLDAFGAPRLAMNYPRMVPLPGVMVCNTGAEDVEPLAGQNWMYYEDGTDLDSGVVDIVVTGWADSGAARDALRDGTMTFCVRNTPAGWVQHEWPGHEGDDDYLLYETVAGAGHAHYMAVVRQGDYLVGVTVTDPTGPARAEVAAEIADKTADNLEALDPDHGRD
ncbi:hypothetical protein [Ornithinimicrobium murale]|uniref:hypothetical protein n=1 Tax=Ornithinimicrobium murale TaxID=1050153 RepID=UPI000E0CEE4F|nr:hypothetical protein [Ornithinimicrobium murale]